MADFLETLKSSTSAAQRAGIVGYIRSINPDQEIAAKTV